MLILEKLKIYRVSSGFFIPLVCSFFMCLNVRSLFFLGYGNEGYAVHCH